MSPRRILALAVIGLGAAVAVAGETVGVNGSNTTYAATIESKVADKPVKLTLTGTALRKKYFFSVYTVGSYLEEGATAKNAEELAAADVVKQLHLVLERDVEGKDLAAAFVEAIRLNYRAPKFNEEVATLTEFLRGLSLKKGEHVWLTHVPGVGFHGSLAGKTELFIRNPAFSKAVWDIYLGKNNIGAEIKEGLTSRL
jgi:Chalcone isomerase-like